MQRIFAGIRSSPGLFVVCTAAVATAVFLTGTFAWAGLQASAWSEALVGARTMVVYFDPKAGAGEALAVSAALAGRGDVARVVTVAPEESEREVRALVGEALPPITDIIGWSIDVSLKTEADATAVAAAVRAMPGVDEALHAAPLEARARALVRGALVLALTLSLLVLAVSVFVVYITLSLALLVRRDEIQIQRIVGATDAFVIGPLLGESCAAGVLGSSLALLLLQALIRGGAKHFGDALLALGLDPPATLPAPWVCGLVGAAVLVSCLGALIAAVRHLGALE